MISKISIIIPTWNGRHLLEQHLPFIFDAMKNCEVASEVIVVDDFSSDGTSDYLKKYYPNIKIIRFEKNKRFARANNAGAIVSNGDILIFLNNDVEVTPEFINPLVRHFEEADVFAVGCNIMMKGIRKESGLTRGYFKRGFLQVEHSREEYDRKVPILYASGSAFACSREKFMELGGFDTIYDPFYWEDTDLSYRGWKRGWRVLFEPKSIVYHIHQATNNLENFSSLFLNLPKERNKYLFIWKNISQHRYLLYHFSILPFFILSRILRFQIVKTLAFFSAFWKLPRAIYSGMKDERYRKLQDREILKVTGDILYYKKCYNNNSIKKDRLKILYVCAYLPLVGISAGSGRMFEIIKRLSSKGHHIDVISYIIEEEFKYLPALEDICNRVEVVKRNYPWQRDIFSVMPSMIDEFYSKEMAILIKKRIYVEDYDIVQFEYLHMAQYAPCSYSGKLVLTEHQLHFLSRKRDFRHLPISLKKIETLLSSLKGMTYEVKAFRKFDAIVTVTQHEKEIIKLYNPYLDIEVVNTGVDTKFFNSESISRKKCDKRIDMIYVGFFRHYPNVDAVIYFYNSIYPLIKRALPKVCFYVVGFGPPKEILKLQDKEKNNIRVTGYVEDIRDYLESAKVFIMPIRLGMGIRGKLLEAWAMRKAVVSTSTACEGIEVAEGKDILIADNPIEFAEKTIRLIKNEKLRKELGEKGRNKVVSMYEWDIVVHKLEYMYQRIL